MSTEKNPPRPGEYWHTEFRKQDAQAMPPAPASTRTGGGGCPIMESKATMRIRNATELAQLLAGRGGNGSVPATVEKLLKLARVAHRNAERSCNGELVECPACHGNGWDCKRCRETGYPTLAREARAAEKMRTELKAFNVRLYEQGDPRGWPLYLIPAESCAPSEDASRYNQFGVAVCPW